MRLVDQGAIALAGALLASCSYLDPVTKPARDLKYTGFFDIGAGYGRVLDTRGGDDDDSQGLMVSFKAYPFGRWYAEPKADLITGLTLGDRNVISLLHQHHRKKLVTKKSNGVAAKQAKLDSKVQADGGELLRASRVVLAHEDRVLLQKAVDDEKLTKAQVERLDELAKTVPATRNWYVVEERGDLWNRLSVFYGRSVSDFDSGGLDSEVNAIGIGFDISPDLALQVGRGFYEVDEGNGVVDSDSSLYFGISLNLNSFRRLLSAITDLDG